MKRKNTDFLLKWKLLPFLCALFLLCSGSAFAQISVQGKVTDQKGEELIGVSVMLKGTTSGTTTNAKGEFKINAAKSDDVLNFSYMGYNPVSIPLAGKTYVEVVMQEETKSINEVVVTALGIKRSEKSLSYATQQISGKELTSVPTPNLLSSLAGKTAGMTVSGSGSGVGSSVKIILRGNRSIQGNNQPLYVIDGTPINSSALSQTGAEGGYGGGIDAGDGLAGINPEDIESMNVLKGATASALYGSQAANGVIVITTKKGKQGKVNLSLTSSVQADIPYMTYKFQDRYNMGVNGVTEQTNNQWGAKGDPTVLSNSFINDFFRTGVSFQNGIAVSGGNEKIQNFLSYQNTNAKGIVPGNTFNKNNVGLRTTANLFNKFMEVEGSIFLTKQDIDKAPSAPGQYFNPVVGLYLFPEGNNAFTQYKDNYEIFNPKRNMMKMNWGHEYDINKNPYWLLNRYDNSFALQKAITKLNVKLNFTDYLNLQLRGSYDLSNTLNERKVYSGIETIAGPNGRYDYSTENNHLTYGDALLSFNKRFDNLSIASTIGTSITDTKHTSLYISIGNLKVPNLFDITNFDGRPKAYNKDLHKQLQSVFGTVSVGYLDMLYLDVTGRNDWSSTLPSNNRSYFYPSVGTSFIFSELINKNNASLNWLNFGKMRFSWTQVGNDMPWGLTYPIDRINELGTLEANTVKPFDDLKPERSNSLEAGLNLRGFNNRVSLDLAFYHTITKNQYFLVDNTSGSGFSKYYINAGEVKNLGFETTLGFTPIKNEDFEWNGYLNFSTNKNTIISLPEQYSTNGFELSNAGYKFRLYQGAEWGEMYAKKLKRNADGKIIVTQTTDGTKVTTNLSQSDKEERIGNINPKFLMGLKNEFRYKNLSLGLLIDGRFGGQVLSMTQSFLNAAGRSAISADARDNGGVAIDGILQKFEIVGGKTVDKGTTTIDKVPAQLYYTSAPAGETSVYSATNVRLRELSISYNLPKSIIAGLKVINTAQISLIGRNLFFLYKEAPYDPDITLTTSGNGGSNTDNFGLPATRNLGISLNITF